MELYVVIDTKGSGRLLGVFDTRARADEVSALSPLYYRMHTVALNRINPDVLDWADDDEQKDALRKLIDDEE
jgi:hypothetical protein